MNIKRSKFKIVVLFVIPIILFILCEKKEEKINFITDKKEAYLIQNSFTYNDFEEIVVNETNSQYCYTENGSIILTEYYGENECVLIPERLNDCDVTGVYEGAFETSLNLEMIKIPVKIANNISNINGFEVNKNLSNEEYIVYTTTKQFTEDYLRYINLSEDEKNKVSFIPPKYVVTWDEVCEDRNNIANHFAFSFKGSVFSTIPSKYDLRNYINIQVENQENLGICYAYANTTSLETNLALRQNENVDFSEIHLAMKSGQKSGGLFEVSDYSYFSRGYGPVIEKKDTILSQRFVEDQRNSNRIAGNIWKACHGHTSISKEEENEAVQALDNLNLNQPYYLMSYKRFATFTGKEKNDKNYESQIIENRNLIKDYIMNYGSVIAGVYAPDGNNVYKDYGSMAVMNCTTNLGCNHEVSLIGWDDNFSKSNFPPEFGVTQDGAWLALNSWGNGWGNGDGTYWISYQDYYVESYNYAMVDILKDKVDVNDVDVVVSFYVGTNIYNGKTITPNVGIRYNGHSEYSKDRDFTVTFNNNINAGSDTATVTITGLGRFTGTTTRTFSIYEKDINSDTIVTRLENSTYKYDGTEKRPLVTIIDGDSILTLGKDYTVEYNNNSNVGTAYVKITGIGNYNGTMQRYFEIIDKDINLLYASLTDRNVVYSGTEKRPGVMVSDGGKVLVEDKDYTIEYINNVNVGTAIIKITGKGYYIGTKIENFEIEAKNIDSDMIQLNNMEYGYDGTEKRPFVTVKYMNKILTEGVDYTVAYNENINIGTGNVIITGIGNYTGTVISNFSIIGRELDKQQISIEDIEYEYDGEEKRPNITVQDGNYTLAERIDYSVEYNDNVNAGIGSATIKGIGIYSGTVILNFTIREKDVNSLTINLENTEYEYDGEEKKPSIIVQDGDNGLTEGIDYVVAYNDNINIGVGNVTITGIGNYTGNVVLDFKIIRKELDMLTVSLKNTEYEYDGKEKKPIVTVQAENDILVEGTDYTISYNNNINAGVATVIVKGIGMYTGETMIDFTINAKSIDTTTISCYTEKYVYNGLENRPKINIEDESKILSEGTDYIITYIDNINAGTGKVRIDGIGNYSGDSWFNFEIEKADPIYVSPSEIVVFYGTTLKDIELPSGFEWQEDINTELVKERREYF